MSGFVAFPVQERLFSTLRDGRFRIIGFGGAIRGSKTFGSLAAVITLCRLFPRSRWAVVRKDLPTLKRNTIPSFNKLRLDYFAGFVGEINQSTWTSTCENGSEIIFFSESLDVDPDLSRWKGLEVNGFVLEEADELAERSYFKAIERAGAWIVPDNGRQPPPYVICTFNPTPGWPKRVFYDPWKNNTITAPYAFIPATSKDNPAIGEAQHEAWKMLPEQEYRRFVVGDWSVLTGRYYDGLDASVHLVPRDRLPKALPPHWEYWGAFDWGYAHWSVFAIFAKDTDGTSYLLDSWWARRQQDGDLAQGCLRLMDDLGVRGKLSDIYAGHDVKQKMVARAASGITTMEVFASHGIWLTLADIDKVNGGRALRRALAFKRDPEKQTVTQPPALYIVETPGNRRVFDQLAEIMPDENDVNKPAKVDADSEGRGGDDGADCIRYGIASRVHTPNVPGTAFPEHWTPDRDDEAYRPQPALPALTYLGGYPIDSI